MLYELRIKAAARGKYQNLSRMVGEITRWDPENSCLYFSRQGDRNQAFRSLGKGGTAIPFADLDAAYKEMEGRPGVFEDTDQIRVSLQHYRQYGAQYARPKSDVVSK